MVQEENLKIDIRQFAGEDKSRTNIWQEFSLRHLKEMRVLKMAGMLGKDKRDWRNVPEHLLVVGGLASSLTQLVKSAGGSVDVNMVETAAILHDAAKRIDVEQEVRWDKEKKEGGLRNLLQKAGYSEELIEAASYTARVPEIYLSPQEQDRAIAAKPLEHLIVAYADARVGNVEIVTLGQARDKNKQKNPADAEFYDRWYGFYKKVESRIFSQTGTLKPEEVTNERVFEMLQQNLHGKTS